MSHAGVIDKERNSAIMGLMVRGIKIVLCMLLIISVATILITPNQSDDMPGVVHHLGKLHKCIAVWAGLFHSPELYTGQLARAVVLVQAPQPPELLTLLCTLLC
jgi:uncharacterized membrane protein